MNKSVAKAILHHCVLWWHYLYLCLLKSVYLGKTYIVVCSHGRLTRTNVLTEYFDFNWYKKTNWSTRTCWNAWRNLQFQLAIEIFHHFIILWSVWVNYLWIYVFRSEEFVSWIKSFVILSLLTLQMFVCKQYR